MNRSRYTSAVVGILPGLAAVVAAEPSLTIYNQDVAVVRRPLALDLTAGINEFRVQVPAGRGVYDKFVADG